MRRKYADNHLDPAILLGLYHTSTCATLAAHIFWVCASMSVTSFLHVLTGLILGRDTAAFPVNNGSPPSSCAYPLYHHDRLEIHTDGRVYIG